MKLNKTVLFTYSFLFSLLLLPMAGTAEEAATFSADGAWRRTMVTDPVFKGETFIMEGGKSGAQTLVLIHGAGDEGSGIFEPFLREYRAEYHLLTFDLPGFGRSAKQNLLYSPAAYSSFLRWVVTKYADGPVVLLGHSMGGVLALHFAATHPEQVARLILVDAAGVLHRAAFSKNFLQIEPPKTLPKILAIPLQKPMTILNHLTGTTVERFERERSGEDIDSILNSESLRNTVLGGKPKTIASMAAAEEDFSPLLGRIRAQTGIIWGAEDEMTPLRTGIALAAKIPGAKLEIIENAGHTPMREQAEIFHAATRRALLYVAGETPSDPVVLSGRSASCNNQSGVTFTGNYESIEIRRCTNVTLQDVTAGYVHVFGSSIEIENSRIYGKEVGLYADHSKIIATALSINAEVAISASGSNFDLAAVSLSGRKAAVQTTEQSSLLFSISTIDSPFFRGEVHGIRRVTEDSPL
ncbi:MAG: alpha/beta hydrolase [Proteobacteria bacterium]|nr:alpha/beta hydrolase [Pseudomonadota bacterium]